MNETIRNIRWAARNLSKNSRHKKTPGTRGKPGETREANGAKRLITARIDESTGGNPTKSGKNIGDWKENEPLKRWPSIPKANEKQLIAI